MAKGQIGVTTTNIFPVIKQFLYSDHEIFLRELVSNAIDATQKLRTLATAGEFTGSTEGLQVRVSLDSEAGTLTVSDNGIGMTADDVERYINQIAFSGAEEFLNKYKDNAAAIIGHFGLGFYSAFMVAKQVDIITKSYKDDAPAVKWTCDGSPEFEMTETTKDQRGTDIVLHIDDDEKEFLERGRIEGLLRKYCRFLPVPIVFGKKQEWKDGKMVDTEEDNIINDVEPLWTRTPSELTDEDYLKFYHAIQPAQEDPLFWIHLNVDYPFNLTGILYFPKIKNNLDIRKDRIQLYCNQVFVTDSVEGVVPEWLMLLQGVIDSPDIPLNVSRSYLQADRNVKKISSYITRKVASRLEELSRDDAAAFEQKWNDIKIFIEYGMLSDEKFCESAMKFARVTNVDGRQFTLDDYRTLIEAEQTDKDGNLIYLYATDRDAQYTHIKAATERGYDVLMMDGQLDVPFIGMLEQKNEKCRFARVDADVIDKLIAKQDTAATELDTAQREVATTLFQSQLPTIDKAHFMVDFATLAPSASPVVITQSEYMRRMKEMAQFQPGMSFYGEMPDSYSLTLNTAHPLVKQLIDDAVNATAEELKPIDEDINATNNVISALRSLDKDNKDVPEDKKQELKDNEKHVAELRERKNAIVTDYASKQDKVKQLIDIALLGSGLLKGEALNTFIRRSIDLL
ncbi:MAG: molecular chaperone HtpG [Muribaculaceae bacterium]|nr:molecular chaperone HtpG [Muribaculaceae bacterium]